MRAALRRDAQTDKCAPRGRPVAWHVNSFEDQKSSSVSHSGTASDQYLVRPIVTPVVQNVGKQIQIAVRWHALEEVAGDDLASMR